MTSERMRNAVRWCLPDSYYVTDAMLDAYLERHQGADAASIAAVIKRDYDGSTERKETP